MANSEVPSFSLGLDLAFDTPPHSPINRPPFPTAHVSDSDPETGPDPTRPILKRLRRGLPPPPSFDADDDIEEFSSQEDPHHGHVIPSAWNRSVCSTTKVSLNGCGVLSSTPRSCSNSRDGKRKELSDDVPVSARLEIGKSGLMFPKLTTSPLRRFQLLDSDSDDLGVDVNVGGASEVEPSSKEAMCNRSNDHLERSKKSSFDVSQNEDLLQTTPLGRFQLIDSDSDDLDVDVNVGGANEAEPSLKEAMCNQSNDHLEQIKKTSFDMSPPLHRFQLLDSDSDDLDVDVGVGDANEVDRSSKGIVNDRLEQNKKRLFDLKQNEDLWKDFSPVKNVSVPTPAFNELCEEYFRSTKYKGVGGDVSENRNERCPGVKSSCQRDQQQWELTDPVLPAHRYFFHEDPRIQQLVRSRLRNFNPLGTVNRVNHQPNVSHIDYMGQFGNGGTSNMQGVQYSCVNSSTRGKNKSSNLNVEGCFRASGGWVDPKIASSFTHGESSRKKATKRNSTKNSVSKSKSKADKSNPGNQSFASAEWVEPKSCTNLPKDAGKRRVQASSQSTGHWYTSPEGKKVYVNKSGQELTGRSAYRQYRKESGAGFKKSKKKTGAKKTNSKKKN